jgi:hypothetical protein
MWPGMRIGKLWLVVLLSALPVAASAQVNVGVNVNVDLDANAYDSTAPGDPVESVDVFYDQLQPYGVWVDEPDIGRVFIPQEDNFVPYTNGHWEYTRLGFVWISSERHAWATSHYGRWAYSNPYGRWVWSPDTEWGPAWVEWRQTSTDFGWAPLPPARMAASYSPPIESWHYCGSAHVLDANVTRYYEPRDRVVVIHRDARPIEHYQTVSSVKIVTGPPPSMLRDHRVEAKPVRIEQKTIGRWTPTEAHAQVTRAQEHHATFEVDNQKRLESNTKIHTAQTKVIETHPQIKVQADARLEAAHGRPAAQPGPQPKGMEPKHVEPARPETRPATPTHVEPNHPATPVEHPPAHVEPNRPATPAHQPPNHVEPARPAAPVEHQPPNHVEPARPAAPVEHQPPNHVEPARPVTPPRPAPAHVEPARPTPVEHQAPAHVEPARPAPVEHQAPAHVEPARPAPVEHQAPAHVEPARPAAAPPAHTEPAKAGEHREPEKK